MKIFVMTDMEGVSGLLANAQVMHELDQLEVGRQYLTWDVNACVEGCFEGGATKVVVKDAHDTNYNLLWDQLDPRGEYIQGASRYDRIPGIRAFDGLILLGYHAMAGTSEAVMEHTMSPWEWQNFWINGKKAGEIAIDAGIAADHGVPTIMVSGDDKACLEARRTLGKVVIAQVKKGLDVQQAILLPRERAHRVIRESAATAVRGCKTMKPVKVKRPVKMRLELVSRSPVPIDKPHVRVIDGRTYEVSGKNVEDALNRLVN